MEKMVMLRSIYRAASFRSSRVAAVAEQQLRRQYHHAASRFPFHGSSLASVTAPPSRILSGSELVYHGVKHTDSRSALTMSVGIIRSFSEDLAHMPVIKDPEIQNAFKDLMAASWDELPNPVVHDATKALSKDTNDKTGQEVLSNVLQSAEAVEEFGGILTSLKMELDDAVGASGENVKPLPEEYSNALRTIFQRYTAYLDAFGPDEAYLRKKVENELGAKMIYLKMRCSGLGAEWGKITVLGTSGLSGSYVEQRA